MSFFSLINFDSLTNRVRDEIYAITERYIQNGNYWQYRQDMEDTSYFAVPQFMAEAIRNQPGWGDMRKGMTLMNYTTHEVTRQPTFQFNFLDEDVHSNATDGNNRSPPSTPPAPRPRRPRVVSPPSPPRQRQRTANMPGMVIDLTDLTDEENLTDSDEEL
jgi:hypothetical protein